MSNVQRRKFVLFVALWGGVITLAYFLLIEDFGQFWTTLLGASYLLLDRWYKDDEESEEG